MAVSRTLVEKTAYLMAIQCGHNFIPEEGAPFKIGESRDPRDLYFLKAAEVVVQMVKEEMQQEQEICVK